MGALHAVGVDPTGSTGTAGCGGRTDGRDPERGEESGTQTTEKATAGGEYREGTREVVKAVVVHPLTLLACLYPPRVAQTT
jgi:hypothetical protein